MTAKKLYYGYQVEDPEVWSQDTDTLLSTLREQLRSEGWYPHSGKAHVAIHLWADRFTLELVKKADNVGS